MAYHFSCLGPVTPSEELPIDDSFPNDQLLAISHQSNPCYANLINFKMGGRAATWAILSTEEEFLFDAKYYV